MTMEDEASSCCSSSASSPSLHRPPFIERFQDIPEPARSVMIVASLQAMRQHLRSAAHGIHLLEDDDVNKEKRIETLELAVRAAEMVGLDDRETEGCREILRMLKQIRSWNTRIKWYRQREEERWSKRRRILPDEAEEKGSKRRRISPEEAEEKGSKRRRISPAKAEADEDLYLLVD